MEDAFTKMISKTNKRFHYATTYKLIIRKGKVFRKKRRLYRKIFYK